MLDRLEQADMADALGAAAAERDATLAGMAAEFSSLDDLLPPPRSA